ncbi:MAG: DUF366 family protein [candidate division FCPU426 bacterium]
MKQKYLKGEIAYGGEPLQSLWAYKKYGVQGDSIVAFQGPCEVTVEALVDVEDALAGAFIYSQSMLHFIVEHFDQDLEAAILRQYLLVCSAQDLLNRSQKKVRVVRDGNDLYAGKAKMSVSIATLTPVSSKIHFGINVVSEGTPVKTLGLKDLRLDPRTFADALLKGYVADHLRRRVARSKVRGVA